MKATYGLQSFGSGKLALIEERTASSVPRMYAAIYAMFRNKEVNQIFIKRYEDEKTTDI